MVRYAETARAKEPVTPGGVDVDALCRSRGILLIEGGPGSGKTHLLHALAEEAQRIRYVAAMCTADDLPGLLGSFSDARGLALIDDADHVAGELLPRIEALLALPAENRPALAIALRPPGPSSGAASTALRRALLAAGGHAIRLAPLSLEEAAALLAARLGEQVPSEPAHAAAELSDGNPAALLAIARALAAHDEPLAELEAGSAAELFSQLDRSALRDAIHELLPASGSPQFEAAATLAVLGREVDADALPGNAQIPALDTFLDEAEASGLLESSDGRHYRFTRELVRCVLAWQVPSRRRLLLRRAAISALEQQAIDSAAAETIAEHYRELGEAPEQRAWLDRAATLAESANDWARAVRLRTRILALPVPGSSATEVATELRALANGHWRLNDQRAAWRLLMRAIDLLEAEHEGELLALTVLDALRIPSPPDRRADLVNRALVLLRARRSHPELEARLLLQHSFWTPVDSRLPGEEAGGSGEPASPVQQILSHSDGVRALREGRPADAHRIFTELQLTASAVGRRGWALQLMASANAIPLFEGELVDGVAGLERSMHAYSEAGNGVHETGIATWLAGVAFARNDAAGLDRLLRRAVRLNPGHFGLHWLRATIAIQDGDAAAALANLPGEELAGRNPGWLAIVHGARAMVFEQTGDHERAQLELARWKHTWESLERHHRDTTLSLVHTATCVDGAIQECDDIELVRTLFTHLQEWSWVRFAPANGCIVDRLRGDLALRLGRVREAEALYRRALELADRVECFVESGKALTGLADIERQRGEYAEEAELLERAEQRFNAGGAVALARRAHTARFEGRQPGNGRPSFAAPAGLTERELEVLRLLAAGRTNREIADHLVISMNTVARHVTHIFEKTGASNRVEAANFGREHGIG